MASEENQHLHRPPARGGENSCQLDRGRGHVRVRTSEVTSREGVGCECVPQDFRSLTNCNSARVAGGSLIALSHRCVAPGASLEWDKTRPKYGV